jgi:aspartyl-tRNA(Asn)/glutamyl-tRNA(Gln) amidotransferase subunit B
MHNYIFYYSYNSMNIFNTDYSKYSKNNTNWEVVIGLEIHAQCKTKTKLFSQALNEFGSEPNSNVDIFDAALPGTLPVLNKKAIESAIKTGLAISAKINKFSAFDRKHYFYPDLPSGYQISQFYHPIVSDGYIEIENEITKAKKIIRINRIHLEQDAGKNIHDLSPRFSYIDLNRAGVPLMEIVSEPDIRSAEEAIEYIKKLQLILKYIGTSDADMEKGNFRCDANVSVRKMGEKEFGTRCEIKNLNSTSNIFDAINFEIKRQIEILENNQIVEQQTRLYDALKRETRKLRGKEEAMDYRYFADPDLFPIILSDEQINEIRLQMPSLPDERRKKYTDMGLNHEFIKNMINDFELGNFFEQTIDFINQKISDQQKLNALALNSANWINVEMTCRMKNNNIDCFSNSFISPNSISKLILSIDDGAINSKIAKDVLDKMFEKKVDYCPLMIIEEESMGQITDQELIRKMIIEIINSNKKQYDQYKSGNEKIFGYFVGQVMKASDGKINPEIANRVLKQELDK